MPTVLRDVFYGSLALLEDVRNTQKGILGRFGGTFANYKEPTRNQHLYPEQLWDKVIESDYVKEMMEAKMLLGELDHPEDYLELRAKPSAFNITKLEKRESEGIIYGEGDILDTPAGQVLHTLFSYGSKVGISSRGSGALESKGDFEEVDPNSYLFITFDAVAQPAVKGAREGLLEGFNRANSKELMEGWRRDIEAASVEALAIYRPIVESMENPELLEFLDSRISNSTFKDEARLTEALGQVAALQESVARLEKENSEYQKKQEELDALREHKDRLIASVKRLSEELYTLKSAQTFSKVKPKKLTESVIKAAQPVKVSLKGVTLPEDSRLEEVVKKNNSRTGGK